jgi:ATP-dependent helicase/nuclease subunit A
LLAQALAYEASHTPSLEGFLAWLDRADIEIKREQDKAAGAVRVMTVHGAKGLEAPVVILPDTLADRFRASPVIHLPQGGAAWRVPAEAMPDALKAADADARQRQTEESRRLLYVAMTRAEHWLIVCGAGQRPKNGETWHGLVEAGLQRLHAAEAQPPAPLTGTALRLEDGRTPTVSTEPQGGPPAQRDLPGWAHTPPAAAPEPPGRVAASALGGSMAGTGPSGADSAAARLRGTMIHALLEELPLLPPASWPATAAARLAALAPEAAAEHEGWIAEALSVLALPEAAPFFGAGAAAEIALSWQAPGGRRIAGRIDRLRVGDKVEAVDFKTDAAPPATAETVPEPYLRQMAVYEAALQTLFPGRPVALSLLWTRTPRLMPLPPQLLDEARARLSGDA